ncbi:hypothetical protein AcW2_005162 [Taiwanofungus camphoratus]|nr:hypothetical protein AcW2_005162 [Antrodia cinnamomea]
MVVRKWSSPERRRGDKRLSPIPTEIYMIIFDQLLGDGEDMSVTERKSFFANLSLVCHLFSALIVRKLFALVAFEGDQEAQVRLEKRSECARDSWLKQLASGEEAACLLSTFVKELEFNNWWLPLDHLGDAPVQSPHFQLHVQVVPRFANLSRLSLIRTPITHSLLQAVTSLQRLESIRIADCTFESPDTAVALPGAKLPSLASFEVSMLKNVEPYIPALASLAATRSLQALKTTEWNIARAIMKGAIEHPFESLESVEIPFVPQDASILARFLDLTPSISALTILGMPEQAEQATNITMTLRDTSLPHLERLRCPLDLLAALLPGRSVSRLSLMETSDWLLPRAHTGDQLLAPLKGRKVQELEVPASLYFGCRVDQYAPRLDKLSICFPFFICSMHCEDIIKAVCALGRRLTLHSLELRFLTGVPIYWMLDLPLQQRMVAEHLSHAYPSVTRFSLLDSIDWCCEKTDGGAGWKPHFHRRQFSQMLATAEQSVMWEMMEVRDLDGTLAALLKDGETSAALAQRLSSRDSLCTSECSDAESDA